MRNQVASKKGGGGSRSLTFMLRVILVEDSENEMWTDPHSCWESDGLRRRRWFSTEAAAEGARARATPCLARPRALPASGSAAVEPHRLPCDCTVRIMSR